MLSRHPLSLYSVVLARLRRVHGADLHRHAGKTVMVVGWWVTGKDVTQKDEEPMEFISIEDTTALYKTMCFPQIYARFCHILNRSRPYVLAGLVEEDYGAVKLIVNDVRLLPAAPQ